MMRRFACLFLVLLLMTVPMLSVADVQYQLYAFPGRIEYVSCSDGNMYTQVQTQYPVSKAFVYVSGEGLEEVSLASDLTAEEDTLFVLHDEFYVWTAGKKTLSALDGSGSLSIVPDDFFKKHKSAVPFLLNVCEGSTVTFLLEEGESSWILCNYDLNNGQFNNFEFRGNLFTFQPCAGEQCFAVTTIGTGEKEMSMIDWNTGKSASVGTLSSAATSIAYDKSSGNVYYIAEGDLYVFTAAEGSRLLGSGLPLWTDQKAFVSDAGELVTWYVDADESLLVIGLNQFN